MRSQPMFKETRNCCLEKTGWVTDSNNFEINAYKQRNITIKNAYNLFHA